MLAPGRGHFWLQAYKIVLADRKGQDQTARRRSLILAFAIRICENTRFAWHSPHYCPCRDSIYPRLLFSFINMFLFIKTPSFQKLTLRKHAYSNILKIFPPKNENFLIKNSDIFHISAQNIDCGHSLEPPRRGGSNEYPQSMFLSRNKKNNVYPCKPKFYYIKVGFKGVKTI